MWVFTKIVGFPSKSSNLIGVFHYKPSILGYLYFWKHPCGFPKVFPAKMWDFEAPRSWVSSNACEGSKNCAPFWVWNVPWGVGTLGDQTTRCWGCVDGRIPANSPVEVGSSLSRYLQGFCDSQMVSRISSICIDLIYRYPWWKVQSFGYPGNVKTLIYFWDVYDMIN